MVVNCRVLPHRGKATTITSGKGGVHQHSEVMGFDGVEEAKIPRTCYTKSGQAKRSFLHGLASHKKMDYIEGIEGLSETYGIISFFCRVLCGTGVWGLCEIPPFLRDIYFTFHHSRQEAFNMYICNEYAA